MFFGIGILFTYLTMSVLPPKEASAAIGAVFLGIVALFNLIVGVLGISSLWSGNRNYRYSETINKGNLPEIEKEVKKSHLESLPDFISSVYVTQNYIVISNAVIIRIKDIVEIIPVIIPYYHHGVFRYWKFSFRVKAKGLEDNEYILFEDRIFKKKKSLIYDENNNENNIYISNHILNKIRGSGCRIETKRLEKETAKDDRWFDMLALYGLNV